MGKTRRNYYLDDDVVAKAAADAKKEGFSLSQVINKLLDMCNKGKVKPFK